MQQEHPVETGSRILQKTAVGFDASVWEFYAALLNGGCLVLAETGDHRDPARLARSINDHQVEIVQVVPSVLTLTVFSLEGETDSGCLGNAFKNLFQSFPNLSELGRAGQREIEVFRKTIVAK